MPSLGDRLAALLMRRHSDIGLLRTRFEVHGWVQRLPRLSCANVEDGSRGVFVGRVRASGGTLVAPVSLQPCVAFRVRRFDGDQNAQEVYAPLEMESAAAFEIEDDTGRALVGPRLFSLQARTSKAIVTSFVCDTADEVRSQVERRRQRYGGWDGDSTLIARVRYEEVRLTDGDPIAIIGAARYEIDEGVHSGESHTGGYRAAPRRVVIDAAPDAMFLYVTDWSA